MKFAVLGHPISHSRSPAMHSASFAALGIEASYEAFDVTETDLERRLNELDHDGYKGVNLTIPLKARALELVDEPTPLARLLGGVNTILFRPDGTRFGDNTDGYGFSQALAEAGFGALAGRAALVLGCGGTGRALALTAASSDAAKIWLANRTVSRAQDVAAAVQAAFPSVEVEVIPAAASAWNAAAVQADLVVHTTSQGLQPGDTSLLPRSAFRPGQWVFDAVYTASLTPILLQAQAAGAQTLNGLSMLVHQGAQSFRIWTGLEPNIDVMRRACL